MPQPDAEHDHALDHAEHDPARPSWLEHPALYLALAALFMACQFGDWMPTIGRADAGAAAPERWTLDDLWQRHGEMSFSSAVVLLLPILTGSGLLLGYIVLRACNVRVFPRCRFPVAGWDPWHLARCAIVYVVVLRLVLGAAGWLQARAGGDVPPTVVAAMAGNAVGLAVCLYLLGLVGGGRGRRLGALGLRAGRVARRSALGVVGAVMAQPVLLVAGLLTMVFGPLVGIEFEVQRLLFDARHVPGWGFGVLFVSAVVVAPVTEEVLFRGFLYGTLRQRFGPLGAISLSAAIFSVLHGHPSAFLSLFVIGFLLAYLYERTGSLTASIAAHALNNLHTMVVVLVVYRAG